MTIEELNKLDVKNRIEELKKRRTPLPNRSGLLNDWDETRHSVMDETKRIKRRVQTQAEIKDDDDHIIQPAQYKEVDVNRIALPLEQDIVNIQTAFTVGTEPKITCDTDDENEKKLCDIVRDTLKRNKIKYINKRVVRSWLSEQEVAEYWYTVEDNRWWRKILNKISGGAIPSRKLKVALWSPFRGDRLYPYFDNYGDMVAFSREYTVSEDGKDVDKLMTIDGKYITIYKDNEQESRTPHGFEKIPIVYMHRDKPYCYKIRTLRERLETLLSNFADCLDYNFFPKLTAMGEIENIQNRGAGNEIIQLENGAEIAYLTWQQSPEMAKLEFENLTERVYSLTNTPRVSVEYLKNVGSAVSGRAFRYIFMGAHMQVSNHAEDVEEYLQRRINFIVSAIGSIYPKMKNTAEMIDIETEIVPYMIDNRSESIQDGVNAVQGGVASLREGIVLAGITDRIEEEEEAIKAEKESATEQRTAFSV